MQTLPSEMSLNQVCSNCPFWDPEEEDKEVKGLNRQSQVCLSCTLLKAKWMSCCCWKRMHTILGKIHALNSGHIEATTVQSIQDIGYKIITAYLIARSWSVS